MAASELKVPDIGDFKDIEIIEVLVEAGDEIAAEQSLITVESDKASMEIPASAGGTITEVRVKVGDKVSEGSVIALYEPAGEAAPADARETATEPPAAARSTPKCGRCGTRGERSSTPRSTRLRRATSATPCGCARRTART